MVFRIQHGLVTTILVFSISFLPLTSSLKSYLSRTKRRRGYDLVVQPIAPFSQHQMIQHHIVSLSSSTSSIDIKESKQKLITQEVITSDNTKKSRTESKHRRKKWSEMIKKLEKFHKKHGHSFVETDHNEPELLEWIKLLRNNYRHQIRRRQPYQQQHDDNVETDASLIYSEKRPRLSEEKLNALRQLDFVWDVQQYLWVRRFDELCLFRAQYGHTEVPIDCAEFPKLGKWLANQKREYKYLFQEKKKPTDNTENHDDDNDVRRSNSLSHGRLEALLSVVDVTKWAEKSRTNAWQTKYDELCDFYDCYGHSNVPQDYSENFALGQWVMNQRTEYKRYLAGRNTSLTLERIELLTKVEFCWDSQAYKWYCQLERLKAYQREHGHVNISKKDDENSDLRLWVIRQRQHYNKLLRLQKILEETDGLPPLSGKLSPMTHERIKALEEVPEFEWSSRRSYTSITEGPSSEEWAELFNKIREKGMDAEPELKKNRFEDDIEKEWTDEEDLIQLWNMEEEDE